MNYVISRKVLNLKASESKNLDQKCFLYNTFCEEWYTFKKTTQLLTYISLTIPFIIHNSLQFLKILTVSLSKGLHCCRAKLKINSCSCCCTKIGQEWLTKSKHWPDQEICSQIYCFNHASSRLLFPILTTFFRVRDSTSHPIEIRSCCIVTAIARKYVYLQNPGKSEDKLSVN